MNTFKTLILMAMLCALVVCVGGIIAGKQGLIFGLVLALGMNFAMFWWSDSIAISQDGAQPVSREEQPELYEIVEELCRETGLPMPRIYISPNEQPNAFATGRDPEHAAVAVTVGIMRILNKREMKAVLAHEIGHVLNRDILITTIACVMASILTFIAQAAQWGSYREDERERGISPMYALVMAIVAPLVAMLIKLAISRSREYEADATGARISHDPMALASALAKLEQGAQMMPRQMNSAFSNLYIVQPDVRTWFHDLMSDHPPIPDRIKRLEKMDMTNQGRMGF